MTTKQIAIQTIQELPDNATWDEIQERIRFVADKGSSLLLTHNIASATSLPWLDLYASNTLVHITT